MVLIILPLAATFYVIADCACRAFNTPSIEGNAIIRRPFALREYVSPLDASREATFIACDRVQAFPLRRGPGHNHNLVLSTTIALGPCSCTFHSLLTTYLYLHHGVTERSAKSAGYT